MRTDEQGFYEAEYALCGRCDGSGADQRAAGDALCPDCDGWGEVEVER